MDELYPQAKAVFDSTPQSIRRDIRKSIRADESRLALPQFRRTLKRLCPEVYEAALRLPRPYDQLTVEWICGVNNTRPRRCLQCGSVTLKPSCLCDLVCSARYTAALPGTLAKREETCLEKYGCRNPMQAEAPKEALKRALSSKPPKYWASKYVKAQDTCLSRYGVDNPTHLNCTRQAQLDFWKDPIKVARARGLRKDTVMSRYGVEHTFQAESVKRKIVKTTRLRYGVSSVAHLPGRLEQLHRRRSVTVGGNVLHLQGYEDVVAKYLHDEKRKRVDRCSDRIFYNLNGKQHAYFPDLVVEEDGVVVEVKCPYTLASSKEVQEMNLAKFRAANRFYRKRGMRFVLALVYSRGGLPPTFIMYPTKGKLPWSLWI